MVDTAEQVYISSLALLKVIFLFKIVLIYLNNWVLPYRGKLRRGKFSSGKIFVGEKCSSLDQNFITAPLKSSFEIFRRGKLFVT